jgi:signal transduction histidine kinase
MRILIAEDDAVSMTVLTCVLQKRGYEVLSTVNGLEAWEALQHPDAPRLVILDWMMAKMDGMEVLRRVRAQTSERPPYIIMLTVRTEMPNVIAGLEAGANDYLGKPFDAGELIARVEVGQRLLEAQDALATKVEELRRSQADLHVLAARLQAVREEERTLLARELHDSFGQHLTALQMDLMWMDNYLLTDGTPDLGILGDRIVAMVPQVERMTEQTQTLCTSLRPNVLFELGLLAAIEWQVEDLAKRSGLMGTMSLPAEDIELDEEHALPLFRIVQEALTNVLRHSKATRLEVKLQMLDGVLELLVQDNGCGFPQDLLAGSKALGLLGMRERAGAMGGTVDFLNACGTGATVRVRIPMRGGTLETQPKAQR